MRKRIAEVAVALAVTMLLGACSGVAVKTVIEMELTQSYDTQDPFIHEKLIYVSKDMDVLELSVSFEMKGESGVLEIADNETKQVLWSDSWEEDVDRTEFLVSLDHLQAEKEYVARFTGTKIEHAKIVITSSSSLVKERERPQKVSKG